MDTLRSYSQLHQFQTWVFCRRTDSKKANGATQLSWLVENTSSNLNIEIKQRWARTVLVWETASDLLVLLVWVWISSLLIAMPKLPNSIYDGVVPVFISGRAFPSSTANTSEGTNRTPDKFATISILWMKNGLNWKAIKEAVMWSNHCSANDDCSAIYSFENFESEF